MGMDVEMGGSLYSNIAAESSVDRVPQYPNPLDEIVIVSVEV